MKPQIRTSTFYLLRFYRPRDEKVLYAQDTSAHYERNRCWDTTENEVHAYRFMNRSDARQATRSVKFTDLLEGPQLGWGRQAKYAYFWEVVKVIEKVRIDFEEEIVTSNAPAMMTIARSAQ